MSKIVRLPRRSFSADDRYRAWPLRRDGKWVLEVFHDEETCCEVPLDEVMALHEVRALLTRTAEEQERRLDPTPLVAAARSGTAEA
jgi:hypothetical protein